MFVALDIVNPVGNEYDKLSIETVSPIYIFALAVNSEATGTSELTILPNTA